MRKEPKGPVRAGGGHDPYGRQQDRAPGVVWKAIVLLILVAAIAVLALLSVVGKARRGVEFDGQRAYEHVLAQCEFGPRPVGSEANWRVRTYILDHLTAFGWETELQSFEHQDVEVHNVIGRSLGEGPPIILGTHYDTRPLADRDPHSPETPVLGANDGASGVAVLLELARILDTEALPAPVWLVFFDAEDHGGIDDWDWSVGAEYFAGELDILPQVVVIVDMVGDADLQIYYEGYSDPSLQREIWAVAAELGFKAFKPEHRWTIIDDHLPFIKRGIPAALLIDFDYPYWHTTQDTPDKVSAGSLAKVGVTLQTWLMRRPTDLDR